MKHSKWSFQVLFGSRMRLPTDAMLGVKFKGKLQKPVSPVLSADTDDRPRVQGVQEG